ncbi:hypothetical protein ACA910_013711 [Epithemia clementina (nom. ined.)]
MAPTTAYKRWNEDLVMALLAREEMARQRREHHKLWQDGAQEIGRVRDDIYVCKTGRVVRLPTQKLKKKVEELCRKILAGDEPVLPYGYFAGGNARENHPYLKHIKTRGGSFAVLMAFYACREQRLNMTKDQIILAAQPYCDEAMEGNYHAGRPIDAWTEHETLVKHGFLRVEQACVANNERAGALRALTYSLTLEGELLTEALLQRHPEILGQLTSRVSTTAANSRHVFDFGASHITGTAVASPSRPLSTTPDVETPSKRVRTRAPDSERAACKNAALSSFSAKASYSEIVDLDSSPTESAVGPASRSKNTRTEIIDLCHDQPLTGKEGAPVQIVNSDSKPPAKSKRKSDFNNSDLLQSENEDDEDELLSDGLTFQRKPDP